MGGNPCSATGSGTSLGPSASTTSTASAASSGNDKGSGRRKAEWTAVKWAIRAEEEEEEPDWAVLPKRKGQGKRTKKNAAGSLPAVTPKGPSPPRLFETEEEERAFGEPEREEESVIMGSEQGFA